MAGVVLALWLTGTSLNIQSFVGAIMAVGVAMANAILLVSFAEHCRREEGATAGTASLRGGFCRTATRRSAMIFSSPGISMYGVTETPVPAPCLSSAGKRATRGSVSKRRRATAGPSIPIRAASQRMSRDGLRFESPTGWTTAVVTPATVTTRLAIESSHVVQRFHSAVWSLFVHISTAVSIPIASSLPTFIARPNP